MDEGPSIIWKGLCASATPRVGGITRILKEATPTPIAGSTTLDEAAVGGCAPPPPRAAGGGTGGRRGVGVARRRGSNAGTPAMFTSHPLVGVEELTNIC